MGTVKEDNDEKPVKNMGKKEENDKNEALTKITLRISPKNAEKFKKYCDLYYEMSAPAVLKIMVMEKLKESGMI